MLRSRNIALLYLYVFFVAQQQAVNPGDERASNGVAYVKLVNGMPAAEKAREGGGGVGEWRWFARPRV